MPLQKLQFRPGINREGTDYSNEGGWYECDKIRFRSGFPEKIGGWIRATAGYFYRGICRALINWIDNSNNNLLGVGTHLKYYINRGSGVYNDITPLRITRLNLNNPFACTDGSPIITVTDTASGVQERDFVTFAQATAFGGFSITDINKNFQVSKIIDANRYEIIASKDATSTVTAGGGASVDAYYEINVGLPVYTTGNGFGAGVWNGAITTTATTLEFTSISNSTISATILSTDTTISLVNALGFNPNGSVVIGSEQIYYTSVSSNQLLGCIRGFNGTTAVGHTSGAAITQPSDITWLNATSTTINVASTDGFTSTGIIIINDEIITYSGKTLTSFTGCVRGTNQSLPSVHALDPVYPVAIPAPIGVYQVTSFAGSTGWGNASDVAFGVGQQLRIWTHDNFGQDLLLAPRGGTLYYWSNNTSTFPRAVTLQQAAIIPVGSAAAAFVPKTTNQVLISDVSRFVITMGSNPYDPNESNTEFDPLLVRWSDQEDPFTWIPDITNQAGEQRLTNGSYIMQAKRNRQEIIIWTDAALYSMQYLGPPYVFGFQLMMDNISIMSPNSAIVVNNVAYWMGTDKFYMYSGTVATLPCSVRQYIYNDLNYAQRFQITCGTNEGYNEVWWYYVSNTEVALATQQKRDPKPDRYVIYNHLERIWYYGNLSRTFWLDSPLQNGPLAAVGDTEQGTLVLHETGVDNGETSTTVPFTAYIQSSDFDIGDGHNFGFVWRIIPDVTFTGSVGVSGNPGYPKVTMELLPRQFSGSPYGTSDIDTVQAAQPYSDIKRQYYVEEYTPQVYTRVRARQMAFKIESGEQLGVAWQLGSPRIDIRQDGRR